MSFPFDDFTNPFATPEVIAVDIKTFLNQKLPKKQFLLSPWLAESGLAQVHAYRGVGKTYFALNVAVAVATGGSFLGWNCPKPKRVLYIDGEMSAIDMQSRLKEIVGDKKIDTEYLKLVTPDLQKNYSPELGTPRGQEALHNATDEADLIIVDNIATLCRTGQENDSDSWGPVQRWALSMRAKGKTVLFIHHSNKSGHQRGTSSREDVLDTVIALKKPKNSEASEGASFEVHFEKNRGFAGKDAEPFHATLDTTSGEHKWIKTSLQDSTFQKCIALQREGFNNNEIAEEIGCHKSRVSRHLKRARDEGLI